MCLSHARAIFDECILHITICPIGKSLQVVLLGENKEYQRNINELVLRYMTVSPPSLCQQNRVDSSPSDCIQHQQALVDWKWVHKKLNKHRSTPCRHKSAEGWRTCDHEKLRASAKAERVRKYEHGVLNNHYCTCTEAVEKRRVFRRHTAKMRSTGFKSITVVRRVLVCSKIRMSRRRSFDPRSILELDPVLSRQYQKTTTTRA